MPSQIYAHTHRIVCRLKCNFQHSHRMSFPSLAVQAPRPFPIQMCAARANILRLKHLCGAHWCAFEWCICVRYMRVRFYLQTKRPCQNEYYTVLSRCKRAPLQFIYNKNAAGLVGRTENEIAYMSRATAYSTHNGRTHVWKPSEKRFNFFSSSFSSPSCQSFCPFLCVELCISRMAHGDFSSHLCSAHCISRLRPQTRMARNGAY